MLCQYWSLPPPHHSHECDRSVFADIMGGRPRLPGELCLLCLPCLPQIGREAREVTTTMWSLSFCWSEGQSDGHV